MKTNVINTTDITFTDAAWENLEECAVNVDEDLATARRKGPGYKSDFLAQCLGGADADREQGWRDYVDALFEAADADHPRYAIAGKQHFDTRKAALAAGADSVVKVEGGYLGFATAEDYRIWRGQR